MTYGSPGDHGGAGWARYWRSPEQPLEAMRAYFRGRAYDRHSHDSYSFGVTESGAQSFTWRGAGHTSAAGMVMAFNPDDAHDGWSATSDGFVYRMIHIGPALLAAEVAEVGGGRAALPSFAVPVIDDPPLAAALTRLHATLTAAAPPLARDERLMEAAVLLARQARARPSATGAARAASRASARTADRVRAHLREAYLDEVTSAELAEAAGGSRHAAYRAFRACYGMAPSEYQRLLRLRHARRLLAAGEPSARAAAAAGFADQAHLTRWFRRCYGITPGAFQRAGAG